MNKLHLARVKYLIVHHSGMEHTDDPVNDIRTLHVNVNKWDDIGYHWIITPDGVIKDGRDVQYIGAHCKGHNSVSFGVCLTGQDGEFTPAQFFALGQLYTRLRGLSEQPIKILPHRHFKATECPHFDIPWSYDRESISGQEDNSRA